jgi:hypothetical protein
MTKAIGAILAAVVLLAACASAPAKKPVDEKQDAYNAAAKAAVTGEKAPVANNPAAAAVQGKPATADSASQPASGDSSDVSDADKKFIQNFLTNLHYMVYFNEKSGLDVFLAKSAVGQADRYLLQQGRDVIDFDQIVRNKNDQKSAYQTEVGESMDMIQFIAQKLNADVYVELDAQTQGSDRNGKFYGDANITARMFETSTATLLGSVTYKSPTTMSASSSQDAVTNALVAGVWAMMPKIIDQSRTQMAARVQSGIKFELVVQKTPDARTMSQFRRNLAKKMRDVEQISSSPSETRYYVYYFGRLQEVEDAVYDAAQKVTGLENLYQVYSRGKSITFNTGL